MSIVSTYVLLFILSAVIVFTVWFFTLGAIYPTTALFTHWQKRARRHTRRHRRRSSVYSAPSFGSGKGGLVWWPVALFMSLFVSGGFAIAIWRYTGAIYSYVIFLAPLVLIAAVFMYCFVTAGQIRRVARSLEGGGIFQRDRDLGELQDYLARHCSGPWWILVIGMWVPPWLWVVIYFDPRNVGSPSPVGFAMVGASALVVMLIPWSYRLSEWIRPHVALARVSLAILESTPIQHRAERRRPTGSMQLLAQAARPLTWLTRQVASSFVPPWRRRGFDARSWRTPSHQAAFVTARALEMHAVRLRSRLSCEQYRRATAVATGLAERLRAHALDFQSGFQDSPYNKELRRLMPFALALVVFPNVLTACDRIEAEVSISTDEPTSHPHGLGRIAEHVAQASMLVRRIAVALLAVAVLVAAAMAIAAGNAEPVLGITP